MAPAYKIKREITWREPSLGGSKNKDYDSVMFFSHDLNKDALILLSSSKVVTFDFTELRISSFLSIQVVSNEVL